jgi:chromosome segregation ATPase
MGGGIEVKSHDTMIDLLWLNTLMKNVGIPIERCLTYGIVGGGVSNNFLPAVLKKEEYAARMVTINKKAEELRKKIENLLQTARVASANVHAKIKAAADGLSENLKQKALQEARQVREDIRTALKEVERLSEETREFVSDMQRGVSSPNDELKLLNAIDNEVRAAEREIRGIMPPYPQ